MAEAIEPVINKLFRVAKGFQASELEMKADSPPLLRMKGVLRKLEMKALSQTDLEQLFVPILDLGQKQSLDQGREIQFDYALDKETIFRVIASIKNNNLIIVAKLSGSRK